MERDWINAQKNTTFHISTRTLLMTRNKMCKILIGFSMIAPPFSCIKLFFTLWYYTVVLQVHSSPNNRTLHQISYNLDLIIYVVILN